MAFVMCPILLRQSEIHWFDIVSAICIIKSSFYFGSVYGKSTFSSQIYLSRNTTDE